MLTEKQLELRKRGIGGSEIGAVVGVNSRQRPIDVWEEKTGRARAFEGNHHTRRGQFLEPAIVKWTAAEAGVAVLGGEQETFVSADEPLAIATPDDFVLDDHGDPCAVVEVKAPDKTWHEWFDDAGRVIVPDSYVCQAAWQMLAVQKRYPKVQRALVGALLDGQLQYKWIPRDVGLESDLLVAAKEFWTYVETDTPPPVDGSQRYAEFLARRFPQAKRPELDFAALPEQMQKELAAMVRRAEAARLMRDQGNKDYEEAKTYLRAILGEHGKITVPGVGKVSWTNAKDSTFVAHEEMASALLALQPEEKQVEYLAQFTKTKTGGRTMRVTANKEKK